MLVVHPGPGSLIGGLRAIVVLIVIIETVLGALWLVASAVALLAGLS